MAIEVKRGGKYTGNGTEQEIKTAENFDIVTIYSSDGDYEAKKHEGMSDTIGKVVNSGNGNYRKMNISSGEGITFTQDGFKVGGSDAVNKDGQEYIWEVM